MADSELCNTLYGTRIRDGNFLPEGHVQLTRMISVPVIIEEKVLAIIVGANKDTPYDDQDAQSLTTLAHSAWEILYHHKIEQKIRQSEERLRKAQQIARFGNISYKHIDKSLIISEELFQIIGIDRLTWTGNIDDFFKYIHPEEREFVQDNFSDIIKRGGRREFEHRVITPEGKVHWVHCIEEELTDKNGNIEVIEGILQDITERKQFEELRDKAFNQITKNAEIMAILNDEIRNPLAIITAVVDLEESEYKDTILQAVKDIDKIIDQLDKGWLESIKVRTFLKTHYGF